MKAATTSRPAVRAAYLLFYGLFAALGAALLARPALLFARGLGLLRPVLPWEVPLGAVALLVFVALAGFTVALAVAVAVGRKPRLAEHAAFLALLAVAVVVRTTGAEPARAADPGLALLAGLRAAADAADAAHAARGSYELDEAVLEAALGPLQRPGFRHRGRDLSLRAKLVTGAQGPQLAPESGDLPGTIIVAVSPDRSRAWLTALTLREGKTSPLTSEGRPVVLQARAGTHSAPGRDPMVPAYPSMRAIGRDRRPH